jgi:signal transduction histidine kinase
MRMRIGLALLLGLVASGPVLAITGLAIESRPRQERARAEAALDVESARLERAFAQELAAMRDAARLAATEESEAPLEAPTDRARLRAIARLSGAVGLERTILAPAPVRREHRIGRPIPGAAGAACAGERETIAIAPGGDAWVVASSRMRASDGVERCAVLARELDAIVERIRPAREGARGGEVGLRIERTGPGAPAAEAAPAEERRVIATLGEERSEGIRVVATIDLARADALARELRDAGLLAASIAAALAAIIGLLLGGRVTRSLVELQRAAERIGRGDLQVTIDRAGGSAGATFSAFNRMAKDLRDTQERAKRAERVAAWRDIARRIAHEIKNPLTPIRMSIETMRRTKQRAHPDFDEIFEESTRTVLEEVERLERIVTEFSHFARLPRPRPVELDLRETIAQVVQLHSPGGDATITDTSPRLPIKMVLPDALPTVRADRDQVTQVLVNLVQNAIDASSSVRGDRGHVEIAVAATAAGGVRVTVSDDGPGIPDEQRANVLEPYFTTKPKGTGLGLAIVDRIVSEHGGMLEVGRSRAGGAAISFTLTREGPPDDPDASHGS